MINFRDGRFYLQDVGNIVKIYNLGSKSGTFLRIKNKADILKVNKIYECGTNELLIEKITYSIKSANIQCRINEG